MSEKRNRWLINVVLIVATVGLLGVTMIPLLTSAINSSDAQSKASPNPSQSASADGRKGELEVQAKGYEAVLQKEPDNQVALRGLLDARRQLNDPKGMVEPLERLSRLNPGMTEYAVLLAQVKQYNGDREGAAQTYREVLRDKPGDLLSLQGLADLLVKQERPEAAIGLLQDTLRQAPAANKNQAGSVDITAIQVLLGKVFATQKRYDEALNVFNQAMQTNPNDFQPVLYKAQVLKEQGRDDQAKPFFDKAASLAPAQFKDQINKFAAAPPSSAPNSSAPSDAPNASTTTPATGDFSAPATPNAQPESSPAPAN
ncbi:tetratricopeptide repeat protein [Myxacorys almedinensis]|uniref:Tetratricopeptide repeat protein n=1 Tax=Myxacorys almedinensis A TaxID=2690445 RepID=A0A8J7Z6M7_9CYAN|nr:tetratricopeptide repeat protein [Myxacorys almedinensis A]